jgi:diadenosine tetraphosphate (Ap4A) HIT family hydrolase
VQDCHFCKRFSQDSVETFTHPDFPDFFYFWDTFPSTPGHLLVIPKRHIANFRDLQVQERDSLLRVAQQGYDIIEQTDLIHLYNSFLSDPTVPKSEAFLQDAIDALEKYHRKPDGYNHGLNDGRAAGRTIDHLHYHIMPRWAGDVEDPRGGIRHMFEGKGNYHEGIKK